MSVSGSTGLRNCLAAVRAGGKGLKVPRGHVSLPGNHGFHDRPPFKNLNWSVPGVECEPGAVIGNDPFQEIQHTLSFPQASLNAGHLRVKS